MPLGGGGRLGDPQALSPSWVPPNWGTLQWREASSPRNAQAVSGPAVTCAAPQIQEHEPCPPPQVLGSPQAGGRNGEMTLMGLHPCLGLCWVPPRFTQ